MILETAKKLKGAGFPQIWNDGKSFFTQGGSEMEPIRRTNEVLSDFTSGYSIPTLEELVSAIGGERIISAIKRNELYRFTSEDFAALWLKDNA